MYILIITYPKNECSDTASISVTENFTKPDVFLNSLKTLTCKDTSLILGGTISPANFTYTWKKDNIIQNYNTLNPNISQPGTYQLIGTLNSSGCKDSALTVITEDKVLPTALAGKDTSFNCKTSQIRLDATVSSGTQFTVNWKEVTGATIQDANTTNPIIFGPGTYIMTVVNTSNSCTKQDTVVATNNKVLPTLKITSVDTINCIKKEAVINASGSSQGANYSLDWSKIGSQIFGTNLNTLQPKVIQGGQYQLLITDLISGCKDSIRANVATDTAYERIKIASAPFITCINRIINLTTSGITGTNYNYLWTTTDGNFTSPTTIANVSVNAGGVYTVMATNNRNGCSSKDSKTILTDTVAPLPVILKPNILTCTIKEITIDASTSLPANSQFNWTTTNGGFVSSTTSNKVTVNKAGTYELTIRGVVNGCESKGNVAVFEDKALPIANAGTDAEINCRLKYALLDGSLSSKGGSLVNKWTSNNGTLKDATDQLLAKAATTGTFRLTITNLTNGCTAFDEVQVTENAPTDVDIKTTTPPCDRSIGSIHIANPVGGKPPYFYSLKDWQTFGTIPATENLPVGKYTVRIKDANECELKKNIEIKEPVKPIISMTPVDTAINELDSATLKVVVNSKYPLSDVVWLTKDSTYKLLDSLTARVFPLVPTFYKVIVTDSLGCKDSVVNLVYVNEIRNVYIPNAFSPNGDGANDFFTIYANDRTALRITKFEVFNRWGEMVFSNYNFVPNDPTQGWDGHFKNQLLNPAVFVYWAEVEFLNGTKKIYKGDVTLMGQ